jgi:heptosyltransferase II
VICREWIPVRNYFISAISKPRNRHIRITRASARFMIKQIYFTIRSMVLGAMTLLFIRLRARSLFPESVRSVLLFADSRVGDSVLALPALLAIKKRYPNAGIYALVKNTGREIWRMSGCVDEISTFKARDWYAKKLALAMGLRKKRFDLALDLTCDHTMLGAISLWLSGARYRIGYDIEGRGLLFNKPVVRRLRTMHITEEIMDLARAAGAETADPVPRISPPPGAIEKSREMLAINHAGSKAFVGIHAGGTYFTQRWPAKRFSAVADRLAEEQDVRIVLFGSGSDEKALLADLGDRMKFKPIIFLDQPLDVTAAAIMQCRLMICNNSGLLHLAAATGVPTVSFMGPTLAHRWWPVGPDHTVIRKNLPCIGCNSGRCRIKTFDCMNLIAVDEVIDIVEKVLANNA